MTKSYHKEGRREITFLISREEKPMSSLGEGGPFNRRVG